MLKPTRAHSFEKLKESVKQRILAGHSRHDLERIVSAAPKRDRESFRGSLLEILVVAATHDRIEGSEAVLAGPMRRRASQLRSLADQMETVAKHAKRLDGSKDSGLDGWAVFAPGSIPRSAQSPDDADWCSRDLIKAMQQCAERARFVARAFGHYTRQGTKFVRWLDVKLLAELVRKNTHRSFWPELARLLTDAYEAAGTRRVFSEEQIRKHAKRLRDV